MLDANEEPMQDEVIQQAVWEYISTNYDLLFSWCMRAARNDTALAEDLMSDEIYRQIPVLLGRWDRLRPFTTYCNGYFYRHLQKVVARKFKARNAIATLDYTNKDTGNTSTQHHPTIPDEQIASLTVKDLLDRLTPLERTAVVLTKMYSYSYREAASKLGMSLGNVSKIINQALDKMREAGE